jgi:hypothetical protein
MKFRKKIIAFLGISKTKEKGAYMQSAGLRASLCAARGSLLRKSWPITRTYRNERSEHGPSFRLLTLCLCFRMENEVSNIIITLK